MDFSIYEQVVVEDDSFEVHEEDIRYYVKHVPLGCIGPIAAGFTQTIADEFSRVHSFECGVQIVLAFDLHAVGKELLLSLSLGSAGVADHLCDLIALEDLLQQTLIGRVFEGLFGLVEQEI
jgi:hypothetical protein